MTDPDVNTPNESEDNIEANEEAIYDAEVAAAYDEDVIPLDALDVDEPEHDEVAELKEEIARVKDQALRAVAEAENTRKRAVKDREDASKFAISGFAKDLLSVSDNLRRALDAMPAEEADKNPALKNLIEGIEATERELLRSFEKNGIEKFEPMDVPFDPNMHEVMFEMPAPDKAPGTIMQLIGAGYTLKGRILRPARVGIAKDDGQGSGGDRPGSSVNLDA